MERKPRRSTGGAPSRRASWSIGRGLAALFAGLLVCSLVAGTLGTIVHDRGAGSGDDAAEDAPDGPGDFERSLRVAIAADPTDAAAMASLANLLGTIGESAEAVDWYERSLELRPNDRETRLNFGTTLADAGSQADAERQFGRLLEADAGDPEATFYLAELYAGWGPPRLAEARELYARAIEIAPDAYLSGLAAEAVARIGEGDGTPAATTADG